VLVLNICNVVDDIPRNHQGEEQKNVSTQILGHYLFLGDHFKSIEVKNGATPIFQALK
jgi:hypothetical protein